MATYDAQLTNDSDRVVKEYVDLDLFFGKKSSNSDIQDLTNVKAVKRSIKNLILTNHYEKPFHPEIGSGVRDILFENMTPLTSIILSKKVQDVIENYEPRARLVGVKARPDLDRNIYEMTIEFYVVNAPTELQTVDVFLERLR